jgi:hypothetical protein
VDKVLSFRPSLTLLEVLRHFGAYTRQSRNKMAYLVKLLRDHRPAPDYDSLPRDARQLLKIDGHDWSTQHSKAAAAREAKAHALMLANQIKKKGVTSTSRGVKTLKKTAFKACTSTITARGREIFTFWTGICIERLVNWNNTQKCFNFSMYFHLQ